MEVKILDYAPFQVDRNDIEFIIGDQFDFFLYLKQEEEEEVNCETIWVIRDHVDCHVSYLVVEQSHD